MTSSFKRNLMIGYGLSLFLLLLSAIASYVSITNLLESSKLVTHTNEVIREMEEVISIMKDAETNQRGFLLTGNETFLEPYNGSAEKVAAKIADVKKLTADNPAQQNDLPTLETISQRRLSFLQELISKKKANQLIEEKYFLEGKNFMSQVRNLVQTMIEREQVLLISRTDKMNKFAASTPTLILVASLLSILVTLISYFRLNADFKKRAKLQQELQQKDEDISKRLNIIQGIADKISSGNYKIRVDDKGADVLGVLGSSLNKMAGSLDESFEQLSQKEWLQTGVASLNNVLIGEKDMDSLTKDILGFVITYSDSQAGAIYISEGDNNLRLYSSYAIAEKNKKPVLKLGEGLAGQCAASKKMMQVTGLAADDFVLSFISGEMRPKSVVAFPIVFNDDLKGVIELASLKEYQPLTKTFFDTVSSNTGIAVHTAQTREKVQQLLEETQTQSEELQAQHSELENINAELETQSEKIQASEEELRVQQEELQQANYELEERSRLLEERNELILERNLDIQAKSEALEQTTRYKSEFLANMSHELRTPLNSILLLSRLLSENHVGNLSDDQIEYAQVIQTSGKGLLTLIDEILDLSKIESGKMDLEYKDVRIAEVISEMKALFSPMANEKEIDFAIETEKDIPQIIETDRLRLDQIIRNLISNALKFTKRGSVILKVSSENSFISFAVKDTGIGIPAEKQEIIFEAFKQADGSTRRQFGGTGLGLSISRELAKLLGGEIRLRSEAGEGSEFTLVLPLSKEIAAVPEKENFTTIEINEVKHDTPELTDRKKYISDIIPVSVPDDRESIGNEDKVILIIEDDTAFARSLLEYARLKGYKGIVAVRGDEGFDLAKRFLPLGILLDVQLPVKSGWEVIELLKKDKITRPIPVHMMSSHQVKIRGLSEGAIDFINKPVAFEKLGEVFQKIEEALSRYPKKVLIVEENAKHAQALSYFLEGYNVNAEVKDSVSESIKALNEQKVDCVILDMGIPAKGSFDTLEEVKKTPGLEKIPIIIFTGKNLSGVEERKIRQYADSIVIKTAQSYQRILDEVSLFLHIVEENKSGKPSSSRYKKMGELGEVLKDKTVLIVDDDVRNIFSLTKSLENYNINVVSAMDGKEALSKLNETAKVDVILMDMMMPEMDGYETTKRLRLMPKYRTLPVIAVTAKAMTGDREKCIVAGASDYITKPVDVDQLVSLLRVWLYQS